MPQTAENIDTAKRFIQNVLRSNFNQEVGEGDLIKAAEKLCKAVP
jgi:hypothetical protein